jgi:hypothetical protein
MLKRHNGKGPLSINAFLGFENPYERRMVLDVLRCLFEIMRS